MRRGAALLACALLGACGGLGENADQQPKGTVAPTTTVALADATAAMWPSADIIFSTPRAAAEDFVSRVMDVPPELGEYRANTIDVFSRGTLRATLTLKQLGPANGWFVMSARSAGISISNLSAGDDVPAARLVVQGQARGFEGNVVVRAYAVGDDVELDKTVFQAGSMGERKIYYETIDLSGAEPGSTVFVVVRGGTGLETDPGEFAAIPLVVRP